MANFNDYDDQNTEGQNINITDPSDPTKKAGVTSDDRLKVESVPTDSQSIIPSLGTNLYYDDMNVNSGGVARDTVIGNIWTKIYDSTLAPTAGTTGLMISFIVTLEKLNEPDPAKSWAIRMVIDGQEVFGSNGFLTSDLISINIYGFVLDSTRNIPEWSGLSLRDNTIHWEGPNNLPIGYNSGIEIYLKKISESRMFRAGLTTLTKN